MAVETATSFWTTVVLDVIEELIWLFEEVVPEVIPAPLGMEVRDKGKEQRRMKAAMETKVEGMLSAAEGMSNAGPA